MPDVFDGDGNLLGDVSVSEKQLGILENGEDITVIYHTPQMLRGLVEQRNGSFTLRKSDDRIVTSDVEAVKAYAKLQKDIRGACNG